MFSVSVIYKVLVLYLFCQSSKAVCSYHSLCSVATYRNTASAWSVSILQSAVRIEVFTRVSSNCTLDKKLIVPHWFPSSFQSVFLSCVICQWEGSLLSRIGMGSIAVPWTTVTQSSMQSTLAFALSLELQVILVNLMWYISGRNTLKFMYTTSDITSPCFAIWYSWKEYSFHWWNYDVILLSCIVCAKRY